MLGTVTPIPRRTTKLRKTVVSSFVGDSDPLALFSKDTVYTVLWPSGGLMFSGNFKTKRPTYALAYASPLIWFRCPALKRSLQYDSWCSFLPLFTRRDKLCQLTRTLAHINSTPTPPQITVSTRTTTIHNQHWPPIPSRHHFPLLLKEYACHRMMTNSVLHHELVLGRSRKLSLRLLMMMPCLGLSKDMNKWYFQCPPSHSNCTWVITSKW